jgi:hypothetical protein
MKLKLLLLVLALQNALLLGTVVVEERALASGNIVLLEAPRADPRDMLRGDHLIFSYKISDVPMRLFSPPLTENLAAGADIFVALAAGTNRFYEVTRAGTKEFIPAAGEVLLRGKSAPAWWNTDQSNKCLLTANRTSRP